MPGAAGGRCWPAVGPGRVLRGGGLPCRGLCAAGPLLPWPALGPLALRRAFRGARGRGSVVHCLQWCASGVRRGGLCRRGLPCRGRGGLRWAGPLRSAVRGALSCMGRAALPAVVHCLQWCASGVPVVPVVRPAGANNNPTNIAKNQCRANINHNILSPQHAISPRPSQKACRGSLPE